MSSPEYQSPDPAGVPDPVTPADGPGDGAGYASVSPDGRGPAAYDIAAVSDEAAITAGCDAAYAVAGPGGARQSATAGLLYSPAGFSAGSGMSGYDIPQGFSGEPDESWANNVQPDAIFQTPVQGMGDYPGTAQDGLQKYGTD